MTNNKEENKTYKPQPIDISNIELNEELYCIIEKLSSNVHEVWAMNRINHGWKYGKKRDDNKKEHPCLVPYDELSEIEKEYDRATASATIKVLLALGYKIIK